MTHLVRFITMIRQFYILILFSAVSVLCSDLANVRFRQARELAASGKLDDAIAEYRAILLDEPDNSQAYFEAGQIRARQQRWNAAIQNFQMVIQRKPDHWNAIAEMAQAYEKLGQNEKAMNEWRRIADKGPDSSKTLAKTKISTLLGAIPDFGAALSSSATIVKAGIDQSSVQKSSSSLNAVPSAESPDFNKGLAAYQAGKWAESLTWWRKVLSTNPSHAGAFYYAGVCRYNLGEFDKAIYNLSRSFSYPEKGYNAHYYLGRIAEKQRDSVKAIGHYNQYLKLTPNAEGRTEAQKRIASLGGVSEKQPVIKDVSSPANSDTNSQTKEPVAQLKESPDGPPARVVPFRKGLTLTHGSLEGPGALEMTTALDAVKTGNYNQAIESFKQLRLQFPETRNALASGYNLAVLYQYLGLASNGKPLLTSLLEREALEPWKSAMSYLLSESLYSLGEPETAQSLLDSVRADQSLGPTAAMKVDLQSRLAEMRKNEKDVPAILEKAISTEADPARNAALRYRLGKAYEKQGLKANALKSYTELQQKCSPFLGEPCRDGIYAMAELHYKDRNWAKALELYKLGVSDYPDPEDSPWGMYQIGNIYRQRKEWTEAVKAYDALMQKYSGSYWADQAKWNKEDALWRADNSKIMKAE